nr:PDR/VanB family oxidoreductase [Variovorax paradoxus]
MDITAFDLVEADGTALPPFTPGSHIDVHLANGLIRQYSLCNDPRETHRYQIATLRVAAGRGGSRAMHEAVHVGDPILISAPKNHFPLAQDATHSLLLAGGIGITPLLCMAEHLWAIAHPFALHYGARAIKRMAFRERILQSPFAHRVKLHFDDGPAGPGLDLPALLHHPQAGVHLYTCGPKGFMDAVLSTARHAGWPEGQLHFEFFGAEAVERTGDQAFELQLARSGRIVRVAANQTVLAALVAAGVQVPSSCEQGVCGTCATRVLQGIPEHRDLLLAPEEQAANDVFLPCCSRAKSARLLLDL